MATGSAPATARWSAATHQWVHADTVAGSAVGFGSNDTVASTTYDTVAGTATRGTVAGTSSAQVTVGGFNAATDFLFYQNENRGDEQRDRRHRRRRRPWPGSASSIVTLPDGTVMTLSASPRRSCNPRFSPASCSSPDRVGA